MRAAGNPPVQLACVRRPLRSASLRPPQMPCGSRMRDRVVETGLLHRTGATDLLGPDLALELLVLALEGAGREEDRRLVDPGRQLGAASRHRLVVHSPEVPLSVRPDRRTGPNPAQAPTFASAKRATIASAARGPRVGHERVRGVAPARPSGSHRGQRFAASTRTAPSVAAPRFSR